MEDVTIGIDIGGTNTNYGFVNQKGKILIEAYFPTQFYKDIYDFVENLYNNLERSLYQSNLKLNIKAIGIGAPNVNYYKKIIEFPVNLKWKKKGGINFIELLKKYYDLPIALTKDANASAIGEMIYGKAKNMKNFAVITLGTGLGAGIFVDGKVLYGHNGFAGELGHIIIERNGRKCVCGKEGCLEAYVSANGIKKTAFELLVKYNTESDLRDIPYNDLTPKILQGLALKGDEIALKTLEITGRYLGESLANFIKLYNSEAIILSGGLSLLGDLILSPTKKYMEENLLENVKTNIYISNLVNNTNAILGSSYLAWLEYDKFKN